VPSSGSATVASAPALARALVRAEADICSIAESHHSLEDVYLELIDEDVIDEDVIDEDVIDEDVEAKAR
jgi:hypothetical protein